MTPNYQNRIRSLVNVYNLAGDDVATYVNISTLDAVISSAMLADNLASQIDESAARAKYAEMAKVGRRAIGIGNYAAMI